MGTEYTSSGLLSTIVCMMLCCSQLDVISLVESLDLALLALFFGASFYSLKNPLGCWMVFLRLCYFLPLVGHTHEEPTTLSFYFGSSIQRSQ